MSIDSSNQNHIAGEQAAPSTKILYFDTNALRSLGLKTELLILATACKEGKVHLSISDITLIEIARQRYTANAQESLHPTEEFLTDRTKYLDLIYRQYRSWLLSHSVQIIDWQQAHFAEATALIDEYKIHFKEDDGSDQRDALILAAFLGTFSPAQAIMVCLETKLNKIAKAKGFEVIDAVDDVKALAQSFQEKGRKYPLDWPSPEHALETTRDHKHPADLMERMRSIYPALNNIYVAGPSEEGEALLTSALQDMARADKETRIDVLAYVQALAPVSKNDLIDLLSKKAGKEAVQNSAERLHQENILQDTGNHWLPNQNSQNARQICEQAMAHRLEEIIELLDGR